MSALEEKLHTQIRAMFQEEKLPMPVREYCFAKPRRFRFDFAWPDHAIACEVEGGVWNRGRHGRGSGIVTDIEKNNIAILKGWRVFRFHVGMIDSGEAIKTLCDFFSEDDFGRQIPARF